MALKKTSAIHISREEVGKVAVESAIKKLILTHINGDIIDFDSTAMAYRNMGFKGEVIDAFDGMAVTP